MTSESLAVLVPRIPASPTESLILVTEPTSMNRLDSFTYTESSVFPETKGQCCRDGQKGRPVNSHSVS